MSHDGSRLKAWRESLPGSVSARALSVALGWEGTRWWQLERKPCWSPHHQDEVRTGLTRILGLTDAADEDRARWIAYVLDSSPAPDAAPHWLPGQCPSPRLGRPRRSRTSRQAADEDEGGGDRTPPGGGAGGEVRPRLMRSVVAILRTQAAGHLDEEEAAAAIIDVIRGRPWNSSMLSPPQAA